MKKIVIIAVVVLAGVWVYLYSPFSILTSPQNQSADFVLSQEYRNDTYNFSLQMPRGFEVQEYGSKEEGSTILLQNASGEGIQILVTPFDEDPQDGSGYLLTQARIQQDLPDLRMDDVQPLEVGSNYGGVAFFSDNEEFEGGSRAVWFVYGGNLYQINTYARLDNLLKAIFNTWQFF